MSSVDLLDFLLFHVSWGFDTVDHSHTGESDNFCNRVSLSDTSVRHCHTVSANGLFNSALHDITVPNPLHIFYFREMQKLKYRLLFSFQLIH